jgi:hypothetical protein
VPFLAGFVQPSGRAEEDNLFILCKARDRRFDAVCLILTVAAPGQGKSHEEYECS